MKPTANFLEIAARQGMTIPSALAHQLSKIRCMDDLRAFLDDVSAAETAAESLAETELHTAAVRRIERLGFGEADYGRSKQIMLGVIFSPEVLMQIEGGVGDEPTETRLLAA